MKQLLLIMAVIATLSSCSNSSNITQDKEIPVEVAKLAKNQSFDTLTVVNTNDKLYIFQKGEYKESVTKTQSDVIAFWIGIILGILGILVFCAFTGAFG